ncbi:secreted ookinete protein, putative [Plasmodium chabaudi chabaudi]|uniref:Secreted ookinete protein, putative n=1 Tax=Plasmodium chabaudi chabaudi TaxID=31271 RepID=A0A077TT47_PLACU|nr:secreted ookinete protein, putative [Plasmodium chabaudi chabaudi]SCM26432.1 secreted ookinete protein, putative [Plasmodium chabaudi chabaudi]VTZ71042.1 secreted ookinete protein, putative [Plasmodium chabaudi chabaudi]|eukprot:XP_016654954.1 secreted ookinete protein, putative [Plasmodium chabaudi chabaudi]
MLLFAYKTWYLLFLYIYVKTEVKCDIENYSLPECDVSIDSAICINNGQKILLPQAKPYGLSAHINFDSITPVDSSGNRNHALGNFFASPGFGGIRNSGLFRKNYIYIPHSDEYFKSADFSYTFFLYILEDDMSIKNSTKGKYCPVIHKGIAKEKIQEFSPAILINTKNGRIKTVLSTSSTTSSTGEEFLSNFKLGHHQWYHIAVVKHINHIRLFVNGILDTSYLTEGIIRTNDFPIYIGGAPYSLDDCDFPFLIDELKIYNISIGVDHIQSEASATLGGLEPSFVYFGCFRCDINTAVLSCPNNYHLCNKMELYIGVYNIMRKFNLNIDNIILPFSPENNIGIGVCCADM